MGVRHQSRDWTAEEFRGEASRGMGRGPRGAKELKYCQLESPTRWRNRTLDASATDGRRLGAKKSALRHQFSL